MNGKPKYNNNVLHTVLVEIINVDCLIFSTVVEYFSYKSWGHLPKIYRIRILCIHLLIWKEMGNLGTVTFLALSHYSFTKAFRGRLQVSCVICTGCNSLWEVCISNIILWIHIQYSFLFLCFLFLYFLNILWKIIIYRIILPTISFVKKKSLR